MTDPLLPCPLHHPFGNGVETHCEKSGRNEWWHVHCFDCGLQTGDYPTVAEAIAAWNTRASDARLATAEAEREALRRDLVVALQHAETAEAERLELARALWAPEPTVAQLDLATRIIADAEKEQPADD